MSKPHYLAAQNSHNRQGYGWEWYQDECIYEGTEYGETSDYIFSGVKIDKVEKKKTRLSDPKSLSNINKKKLKDVEVEYVYFRGKHYYKVYLSEKKVFMVEAKSGMTAEKAVLLCMKQVYE